MGSPPNLNLRQQSHLVIKRTHKPCIMCIEACSSFDVQDSRAISIRLSDNVKNDTKQIIKCTSTQKHNHPQILFFASEADT